jgi:hypothetical protein
MIEDITKIELVDFPKQTDEVLYEIMAFYGQTYDNTDSGLVWVQYRYALEIIQLRQNKKLVEETSRLVNKTLKVAKWTMIIGIGTAILAIAALMTLYLSVR